MAEYDIGDPEAAKALAQWLAGVRVVRAAHDNDSKGAGGLLGGTILQEVDELSPTDVIDGLQGLGHGIAYVADSLLRKLAETTGDDPHAILDNEADEARRKYRLPPQTG